MHDDWTRGVMKIIMERYSAESDGARGAPRRAAHEPPPRAAVRVGRRVPRPFSVHPLARPTYVDHASCRRANEERGVAHRRMRQSLTRPPPCDHVFSGSQPQALLRSLAWSVYWP